MKCTQLGQCFADIYFHGSGRSLHCESSLLPKYCLEHLIELHTCLGCDRWKASSIASDTVRLSKRTFFLRSGSDYLAKYCLGGLS